MLSRARTRRSPIERRVAADLGVHGEGADVAAAARQLQIEAAQRFAVVAGDRAELDIEIEVGCFCLALLGGRAGQRRLDEIAAVIDIAAHGDAQRAVAAAIGLERRLVAVGQRKDRKIRRRRFRLSLSNSTEPLHGGAGAVDAQSSKRRVFAVFDQHDRWRAPACRPASPSPAAGCRS